MLPPKPDWLQQLFPWGQRTIIVNGRTMVYVDEGNPTARPVLLLHGNLTFSLSPFHSAAHGAGYRVIVPDWVGTGYSDHPRVDAAFSK